MTRTRIPEPTEKINGYCIDILRNIVKVRNPEEALYSMRNAGDRRSACYKEAPISRLRKVVAFWLRDLNLRPGKLSFNEIAGAVGHTYHDSTLRTIRGYSKELNKIVQEDPETLEAADFVDREIEERKRENYQEKARRAILDTAA